jgi:hypothetical protein
MTGSLNAYAKHRKSAGLIGGTLQGVQKAVASGRITVTRQGANYVVDFDRADAEWASNTHPTQGREEKRPPRPEETKAGNSETKAGNSETKPDPSAASKFSTARTAKMAYDAATSELKYKQRLAAAARSEELLRESKQRAEEQKDFDLAEILQGHLKRLREISILAEVEGDYSTAVKAIAESTQTALNTWDLLAPKKSEAEAHEATQSGGSSSREIEIPEPGSPGSSNMNLCPASTDSTLLV